MGIVDAYGQPLPDPNAPTIAWGSPQATQLARQNAYSNPLAPLDALGAKLDADRTARAGAVQFANGQTGGAGASDAPPAAPLQLPGAGYGAQVLKAHDVQLGSDAGIEAKKRAQDEAKSAIDSVARAKFEENEANAQAMAGYQGTLRGGQMDQEKADAETRAKTQAAYDEWKKAQDIDPDHYLNNMSKGKRVMLSIAASLAGAGQGLLHQGGPNPILQQIEQETNRDTEAQKSKRDKAMSLYTHMREQGLDEQKAHALTFQHNAELAKAGLDAAVVGNASPTRLAEAEQHKAVIDDAAADYVNKAFGRAQQQVVGGGKGWTDAMAKEAQTMVNEDHAKGGTMSIENAMTRVARSHNLPFTGGSVDANPIAGKGGAGNSRALGTMHQYHNAMNEAESGLSSAAEIQKMMSEGGKLDAGRTAHGASLRTRLVNSIATMMAVGSKPGDKEIEMAEHMVPADPNAYQWTGADKQKIQGAIDWLNEKKGQTAKTMQQLGADPFAPSAKEEDTAASLGAVER